MVQTFAASPPGEMRGISLSLREDDEEGETGELWAGFFGCLLVSEMENDAGFDE